MSLPYSYQEQEVTFGNTLFEGVLVTCTYYYNNNKLHIIT